MCVIHSREVKLSLLLRLIAWFNIPTTYLNELSETLWRLLVMQTQNLSNLFNGDYMLCIQIQMFRYFSLSNFFFNINLFVYTQKTLNNSTHTIQYSYQMVFNLRTNKHPLSASITKHAWISYVTLCIFKTLTVNKKNNERICLRKRSFKLKSIQPIVLVSEQP